MKINTGRFVKYVLMAVVVVWLLALYPLFKFASSEFVKSFAVGSLISLINSVAGFILVKRGFERSNKEFLKLTIGSMGVRLFVIAGLILFLLEVLNFEIYGLLISLLLFYFIFLAVEILYLNKLTTKREF
ncbi:hypothetical protein [Candidatus Chrysopegis kryptomonas]|uniref:ATP synthase I chain n=1 Tax=Candidatus Chryseopegocella kryptomonas TaxID=1633643 RepID=A0A0P1NYU9_9BACT|nr:hypothetical protein [Candidatus Chrysopegis kryptomonas]CUT03792.1 hypothetical protein JGI23_01554 [Candidatus Chrysopegis kryptomonas]